MADLFCPGTVAADLAVPIGAGLMGSVHPLSLAVLALVGALSLVGDFFAKYTVAKAGIYVPVVPAGAAAAR